jgi:DNA-binding NarL/FixJ family response regulator
MPDPDEDGGDMSAGLTRILLLDDHPVVRQGIAGLLSEGGFDVVGQAGTAADAIRILGQVPVQIAVLDLSLEEGTGYEVLAAVRDRFPGTRVVVYSVHADSDRVRRAFEGGAMGYVTKPEDPEILAECLRHVAAGERFLSPRAARAMADALARGPVVDPEDVLSRQELQVYRLLGTEGRSQEIAARMGLSVRTIETYYDRILTKLGLPGRSELRRRATEDARRRS